MPRRQLLPIAGLIAGALLATGLLTATPAQAVGNTTTWTSPTAGATLRGTVGLAVTTTDTTVTFAVDGTAIGGPVTASGGAASASFDTTKVAAGTHSLVATGCTPLPVVGADPMCDTATISVTVDNSPQPPTVSAAAGGTFADVDSFTVAGTAQARVQLLNAGGTALYDQVLTLPAAVPFAAAGLAHAVTIVATTCVPACTGPATTRRVTVVSTRPTVHATATTVYVGRHQPLALSYTAPVAETVQLQVLTTAGAILATRAIGAVTAGDHAFRWDGTSTPALPDATYMVTVVRVGGLPAATRPTTAVQPVTLDTRAPVITALATPSTFRSRFVARVTTGEPVQARLVISRGGRPTLTTAWTATYATTATAGWDGTVRHRRVAPGSYTVVVQVRDRAGNLRGSRRVTTTLA